jgi:hypothetical protein
MWLAVMSGNVRPKQRACLKLTAAEVGSLSNPRYHEQSWLVTHRCTQSSPSGSKYCGKRAMTASRSLPCRTRQREKVSATTEISERSPPMHADSAKWSPAWLLQSDYEAEACLRNYIILLFCSDGEVHTGVYGANNFVQIRAEIVKKPMCFSPQLRVYMHRSGKLQIVDVQLYAKRAHIHQQASKTLV